MKISDRDKKLILFVLLVAIIVLPIFLFIRPQNAKTKDLESQLVSLNERYDYLKGLYDKKDDYEKKIVELNTKRDELIEDFPGGILFENTVMFLRATELHFDSNFRAQTMMFADDEETVINDTLTAIKARTTVNYCGEYSEIKEFINYIFSQKDTMILSSMTMDLDPSTNMIKGTFILDQYAIDGNGKEVEQTKIPGMEHGQDRLYVLERDENGNIKSYLSSLGVDTTDETDVSDDDEQDL